MRLDHINIATNDIDQMRDVLVSLLLLQVGERPPFASRRYWLYGEGYPIVHLTTSADDPGNSTGALNHIAFKDKDFDGLLSRLTEKEVSYDVFTVPTSGIRQVFFKITHDVVVEVDFDPIGETPPSIGR